jgi:hypothetical protein
MVTIHRAHGFRFVIFQTITKAYMDRQRAARAGAATSVAKAEAARRNGAKGGRPRKATAARTA